jgi:DNA-binding XRE family transcriptional regulator
LSGSSNGNPLLRRVALAVPEQRRDLDLSQRDLAAASGVSRATIAKLERGERVDPALVIRLALAMAALELYGAPRPAPAALSLTPFDRIGVAS